MAGRNTNKSALTTLTILILFHPIFAQTANLFTRNSVSTCTHPPPTCSSTYYKVSDESQGLATSCAAVDQAADPVVGLDQNGCQSACDAMEGCDTINFRWKDPNFNGTSTCYRKNCGDFKTAACTLFSKHKDRDVYTKACGVEELWGDHVIGDAFGSFAGVTCPDEGVEAVAEVLSGCAAGGAVEGEEICSTTYYKIADEFNGQTSTCPPLDGENKEVLLNLDLTACQAKCDAAPECDTIAFRWRDPSLDGVSTCRLRHCGDFDTATCSMSHGQGKDVYTKACGAEENWSKQVIADSNGLFAAVECAQDTAQSSQEIAEVTVEEYVPIDCTDYTHEGKPQVCVDRYYKISDEFNGLATSCAAVDQAADPVIGLDQAGCQHACDELEGCDTINFRWKDPNFNGTSTCYRKNCGDFKTAACTLFSKHKSRDVYTKACGAADLYAKHVVVDGNGLFAGISCPDETVEEVQSIVDTCAANEGSIPDAEPTEQSCTMTYYKISDEFNGLATSCAAVDQAADPVVGIDQAGCQNACDELDGCDTINFRWNDPNFNGTSTCYRKNCGSFETAACTLFSKHKARDVYTKACGSEELWASHVLTDGDGLFQGVRCPTDEASTAVESTGQPVCTNFISTNRTNSECDVCSEWSGVSTDSAFASVRTCLIWEKTSENGISSCKEYAPSALQIQQQEEYNKYLQERWSEVGVCSGQYTSGTTCEITKEDGTTCQVRDQPCHGGTELGGVAGVLSAGWQMTFGTAEDNHVCTMCGRGTYGSCEDACAYRRNFFWSGYNLGSHDVQMTADEVDALLNAFIADQPDETYDVPQPLELVPGVVSHLPKGHPLSAEKLPSQSIYSIISVDDVLVTVRDQLSLIAVSLRNKNANISGDIEPHFADTVLSTSGVKVYETCSCFKCPRGTFQDGLGETECKSCQEILPGSDTTDNGAPGPELCSCLEENDVFLASDGSQCIHCDLVRTGQEHAPPGICECEQDFYEVVGGHETESTWVTCTSCPAFSTTFNLATGNLDYGSSIESCHCIEGTYASEGGCASCGRGRTSPPDSKSSSDCVLTDSARLTAIVIPTGLLIFAILMYLMYSRFQAKLEKLEAEKRRQIQEKINEATESVNHLAHPIILVTADWFLNAGRMVKHEDARAQSCFITIDTVEELKRFKKFNKVIFLSHQWLAWAEPDPQNIQYDAMKTAFEELIRIKELEMDSLYVWLDYTSIPQTHRGLQKLSINSLTNYAGSCDYFIIVAPGKIYHADTGTLCDKYSYQMRSWCRAEQLAHSCRKGVENMYIANDDGLEPLNWDWIKRSLQVFGGELSCCLRGHVGMDQCDKEFLVTPALGLYCELLAMEKLDLLTKDKKEVLDFFKSNKHEVFPASFAYHTPNGQQTKELFGEIMTVLDQTELVDSDDGGIMAAAIKSARMSSIQESSLTDRVMPGKMFRGVSSMRRTEGDFSSTDSLYEEFLRFIKSPFETGPEQSSQVNPMQVDTAIATVQEDETSETDSSSGAKFIQFITDSDIHGSESLPPGVDSV